MRGRPDDRSRRPYLAARTYFSLVSRRCTCMPWPVASQGSSWTPSGHRVVHRGPGAVNSRLGSVAKSLTSDRSDDPLTINGVLSPDLARSIEALRSHWLANSRRTRTGKPGLVRRPVTAALQPYRSITCRSGSATAIRRLVDRRSGLCEQRRPSISNRHAFRQAVVGLHRVLAFAMG